MESESYCQMNWPPSQRDPDSNLVSASHLLETAGKSLHLPEPHARHLQGEGLGDSTLYEFAGAAITKRPELGGSNNTYFALTGPEAGGLMSRRQQSYVPLRLCIEPVLACS